MIMNCFRLAPLISTFDLPEMNFDFRCPTHHFWNLFDQFFWLNTPFFDFKSHLSRMQGSQIDLNCRNYSCSDVLRALASRAASSFIGFGSWADTFCLDPLQNYPHLLLHVDYYYYYYYCYCYFSISFCLFHLFVED